MSKLITSCNQNLTGVDRVKDSIMGIDTSLKTGLALRIDANAFARGLMEVSTGLRTGLEAPVFIIPIECTYEATKYPQGYAPDRATFSERCVVLCGIPDDTKNTPYLIGHECSHALGLLHSFYDGKDTEFVFTEENTDNIMDYYEHRAIKELSYWKWQWEKIKTDNINRK